MNVGRLAVWVRAAAGLALLGAVLIAVVTYRMTAEGERQMADSDAAFNAGKVLPALDHAGRAATLYAPGAPHVERAYARMVAIAAGGEARADFALAERAWRAIRGALMETRHLEVVEPELFALANENLARLVARDAEQPASARQEAQAWLRRDDAPRPPWVLLLGLGLGMTVLGLLALVLNGLTARGDLIWERARWPLVIAVSGLACWAMAVVQA